MRARTTRRRTGRHSVAATTAAVVTLLAAGCSDDPDDTIEPAGAATAFEAFETRWNAMPSDERLLQCRVFGGELADGPSCAELHEGLTRDDTAIAGLSFDDWSAFMDEVCRRG